MLLRNDKDGDRNRNEEETVPKRHKALVRRKTFPYVRSEIGKGLKLPTSLPANVMLLTSCTCAEELQKKPQRINLVTGATTLEKRSTQFITDEFFFEESIIFVSQDD